MLPPPLVAVVWNTTTTTDEDSNEANNHDELEIEVGAARDPNDKVACAPGTDLDDPPSVAACTAEWVAPSMGEPVQPEANLVGVYQGLFDAYLSLRHSTVPFWSQLADVRTTRLERNP